MQAFQNRPSPGRTSTAASTRRGAFSLIELIVVIMIIAILSGLLLAGVQGAVNRARVTAVAVDIKNLEQGIKEFQAKFGVTEAPPSRIHLYEQYSDWPNASMSTDVAVQRNVAAIRRLWPSFLGSDGRPKDTMWSADLNGNMTTSDDLELNGAECLVFFLGGVLTKNSATDTNYIPVGFSSNPLNPFALGGTRVGPFLELNPSRLKSTGGNANYPEYIDAFPGSSNPYLYFSAYGGRGYRILGDDSTKDTSASATGANKDEVPLDIANQGFTSVYLQKDVVGMTPAIAWNPKTYQIISAGISKEWGTGGLYSSETGVPQTPTTRKVQERDNITNFAGRELQ